MVHYFAKKNPPVEVSGYRPAELQLQNTLSTLIAFTGRINLSITCVSKVLL